MPIVRLPGGDLRDEIRQPLYSTLSMAGPSITSADIPGLIPGVQLNGFNGARWFSRAAGLERWQTNLRQAGLLETAVSFRVQGMNVDAQWVEQTGAGAGVSQSHMLPLLNNYSSVRVHIGEKDYWEGPLSYLMGRITMNSAQTVAATSFIYQHTGLPAIQGVVLSGRHVIDINPLQSFFAELSVDIPAVPNTDTVLTVDNSLNLKFSFKGLQRRPVQ